MERELLVVDDIGEEAVGFFLASEPRTVLLSGGRTPEDFYRRLADIEYPWDQVEFFFGDERCAPPADDRSNARMAGEALLSRIPARSYPIDGEGCDAEGYERTLRRRFGDALRFDLAIYGLGADGHTASLFPKRPEVDIADQWVVRVPEAAEEPFVPRVSLTVPALSATTLGIFLVEGEDKREPLRRLLAGDDIPAARVTPERLVILADPSAAPG